MRLQAFIGLFLILLGLPAARAAALLDRGDFPAGYNTALAFDLTNETAIRAELFALPTDDSNLSILALPFSTKNSIFDGHHVVFSWQQPQATFWYYNVRPSRSSSLQIASFDPTFEEKSALDALIRNVQTAETSANLHFVREGLQRLFLLRIPEIQKVALEGTSNKNSELNARFPDLIAIKLPKDHVGRTFPGSGRMYDPEPLKSTPILLFASNTLNQSKILRVRYDLPQPDWVAPATRIGLKAIAILLPALLLYWTKSDKINPQRYRAIASVVALLIFGIYGYLIYATITTSGDLNSILEDIGFAVITTGVTWGTYWATTKVDATQPPTPNRPMAL